MFFLGRQSGEEDVEASALDESTQETVQDVSSVPHQSHILLTRVRSDQIISIRKFISFESFHAAEQG